MASYDIFKSDGTLLVTIADGTINSAATSLTFIGRGIVDYAQNIAENRFHVLENFANITAPGSPVAGQLWWDTTIDVLKVYDGNSFNALDDTVKNFIEPTDIVVINSKHQLIVYDEYVIEIGGTLIIELNAALVIL